MLIYNKFIVSECGVSIVNNMENNKKCVDFNCDLAQTAALEDEDKSLEIIDYMSSVNISCGFHAGCPVSIKRAVEHCKFKNKVIGAHIGLPVSFENPADLSDEDIESIVIYQLGAISSFAKANSLNIEHVRPHGLMYKFAAENKEFSLAVAKAIKKFSEWLVYYGAAGKILAEVAEELDINIAKEVLLNKTYNKDGGVNFDSDFKDTGKSLIRIRRLINLSEIDIMDDEYTKIDFDTIHFSSYAQNVAELAKEANTIIIPRPVNYNKVVESGWV